MPEPKRLLKVFLCHAHSDRNAVEALYEHLVMDGVDAWLDKKKLLPGMNWEYEIRKAVRESDVVVVCLSKDFNQAGFRQKEVRLALDTAMEKPEGEIFIIPARLDVCESLESLRKWHRVDLFEPHGYELLMSALQLRANTLGAELQPAQKKNRAGESIPAPKPQKSEAAPKPPVSALPAPVGQDMLEQIQPEPASSQPKQQAAPTPILLKPTRRPVKMKTEYVVALIGAAATLIAGMLASPFLGKILPVTAIATITPALTITSGLAPTTTYAKAPLPFMPAVTTGPNVLIVTDPAGNQIEMRLVPAGEFTMGSNGGDEDESPAHQVTLPDYYMDVFEVTNKLYQACVAAEGCTLPQDTENYDNSDYANHPVVNVDWNQAKTYCEWRGARLPSEAEWEKAARGPDGRTYPWGEGIEATFANYSSNVGGTTEVGKYPEGISPYGMYDMVGNVYEWVDGWYDAYPGNAIRNSNYGTQYRVMRGGTWSDVGDDVRAAGRSWSASDDWYLSFGFRCSRFP